MKHCGAASGQSVRYGSLSRELEVPDWYPKGDGDAVHGGADLVESDCVYGQLRDQYARHVRATR